MTTPGEPEAAVPALLLEFMARGKKTYRGEDGDWEIKIEPALPPFLMNALPPRSLIIGNNGCGDHLFLAAPESDPRSYGPTVFVYWHDGQEIQPYLDTLELLTNPPKAAPSNRKPVLYFGGDTPVLPGDRVSVRGFLQFWRRFPGTVNYVPGISKKNRDLESGGLAWVGVRFDSGIRTGYWVDPDTSRVKKSLTFLGRATSKVEEIAPDDDL